MLKGKKKINPFLSASAVQGKGVGAGLLPRPSMPLHSLYSDPDHPGEDKNFPTHSGWWPCQYAPRNMVTLAGQSGQRGRHPGERASGFLNCVTSIQPVLSTERPLFPAGASIPARALLPGARQALQLRLPDPSSSCTPCQGPLC